MKNLHKIILLIAMFLSTITCDSTSNPNFQDLCEGKNHKEDCVRNYFRRHARCHVITNPNDKPVYRERHTAYMPKINLTIITTKTTLKNLHGDIEKFYLNKKTGNLVMSVNFKGIVLDSPVTKFIISQRGLEPKMLTEHANGTYPAILTAVIPAKKKITLSTLKQSDVSAYLPQGNVNFYIGPKVTESKDPVVASVAKGLTDDVPTAVQEIFLTESSSYFLAYLQKYICNFGIPLSSAP